MYKRTRDFGYISPTEGIGNLPALLFEAKVQANYYLKFKKESKFLMHLTSSVLVRMKREQSLPIINPSYRVIGAFVYNFERTASRVKYASFEIGHHSNGQKDSFWDWDNNVVDYEDGNFMTNYLAFGYGNIHKKKINQSRFTFFEYLQLEYHPEFARAPSFYQYYNDIRLNGRFQVTLDPKKNGKIPEMKIDVRPTILLENVQVSSNAFPEYEHQNHRLNLSLTYSIRPLKYFDFMIFARYYYGQDYYNVYFLNRINVFSIGLLGSPVGARMFGK